MTRRSPTQIFELFFTLQYVPARYEDGRPNEPLDPVEYAIDYSAVGKALEEKQ